MCIYILEIKCQTAYLLYSCIFKNQYYLFLLILFLLLFMINDRVLTEYFFFVELGQVIAITILIILAIIGYIQIKKEK